jgi:hypothetical protein
MGGGAARQSFNLIPLRQHTQLYPQRTTRPLLIRARVITGACQC